MTTEEDRFQKAVQTAVASALSSGAAGLQEVLACTEGADPRVVAGVMNNLGYLDEAAAEAAGRNHRDRTDEARRKTAAALYYLPAADPLLSQWWFTLDACHLIATRVSQHSNAGRAGFIGAPSAGIYYKSRYGDAVVLDVDPDVAATAQRWGVAAARRYDVADPLPDDLHGTCDAVVVDPPWYQPAINRFVARAADLCRKGGHLLTTYPPRLTRPGVETERLEFIRSLEEAGFRVTALEPQCLEYCVPHFELQAFRDVPGFSSHPWRLGDLVTAHKVEDKAQGVTDWGQRHTSERFTRDARRFRVFLSRARADTKQGAHVVKLDDFSNQISTRAYDASRLAVWSSCKSGASVKDPDAVSILLVGWADGLGQGAAAAKLQQATSYALPEATAIAEQLESALGLWSATELSARRTPEVMAQVAESARSAWASPTSKREHEHGADGYRLEFQRDRDRVLWSSGLKRLANKTQVFGLESDDNVRQRLAHSIEVMQLASTIGSSFGLDRDLVEAGSLAHDIGHTPFGHAGEHAIDCVFEQIQGAFGGFNHYEHGVDIVRYLEDVYAQPAAGGFAGLNLTPEVSECILKHTYCLGGHRIGQAELYARSKHTDLFPAGPCHLEGQAVRAADKISYLITDLEDGVRLGVFTIDDLTRARLFRRSPIDLRPSSGESLLERFVAQRRALLQVLMEDVIDETARRLAGIGGSADVRKRSDYVVAHSVGMAKDMTEVWNTLQSGKLHRSTKVVGANLRSGKIVGELLLLFSLMPDLVENQVRRSHRRLTETTSRYMTWYRERNGRSDIVRVPERLCRFVAPERLIGMKLKSAGAEASYEVPLADFIMAKDYVASMTDGRARRLHSEYVLGGP